MQGGEGTSGEADRGATQARRHTGGAAEARGGGKIGAGADRSASGVTIAMATARRDEAGSTNIPTAIRIDIPAAIRINAQTVGARLPAAGRRGAQAVKALLHPRGKVVENEREGDPSMGPKTAAWLGAATGGAGSFLVPASSTSHSTRRYQRCKTPKSSARSSKPTLPTSTLSMCRQHFASSRRKGVPAGRERLSRASVFVALCRRWRSTP